MSSSYDKVHLPLDLCLRLYVHARCKRDTHQQTHITRESTIFAHTTVCVCVCTSFRLGCILFGFVPGLIWRARSLSSGLNRPARHTRNTHPVLLFGFAASRLRCCLLLWWRRARMFVWRTHTLTHTYWGNGTTATIRAAARAASHSARTEPKPLNHHHPSLICAPVCVCARLSFCSHMRCPRRSRMHVWMRGSGASCVRSSLSAFDERPTCAEYKPRALWCAAAAATKHIFLRTHQIFKDEPASKRVVRCCSAAARRFAFYTRA